jgi:hypothetical protein
MVSDRPALPACQRQGIHKMPESRPDGMAIWLMLCVSELKKYLTGIKWLSEWLITIPRAGDARLCLEKGSSIDIPAGL